MRTRSPNGNRRLASRSTTARQPGMRPRIHRVVRVPDHEGRRFLGVGEQQLMAGRRASVIRLRKGSRSAVPCRSAARSNTVSSVVRRDVTAPQVVGAAGGRFKRCCAAGCVSVSGAVAARRNRMCRDHLVWSVPRPSGLPPCELARSPRCRRPAGQGAHALAVKGWAGGSSPREGGQRRRSPAQPRLLAGPAIRTWRPVGPVHGSATTLSPPGPPPIDRSCALKPRRANDVRELCRGASCIATSPMEVQRIAVGRNSMTR